MRSAFIGLLIAIVAIIFIFALGQTAKLTCTRSEPREPVHCSKQTNLFAVIPLGEEEIRGVQGATLAHCETCEDGGTRVELITANGNVPFTFAYFSGLGVLEPRREAANQINALVQVTERTDELVITDNGIFTVEYVIIALIWMLGSFAWNRLRSASKR